MLKLLICGLGSVCLLASAQASTLNPVQNVAALSTLAANDGDIVTATGYTTAGDGGGGDFVWVGSSAVTADFGLVFTGTSGTNAGRWLRTTSDVDVRMFGAKGDGVTNDRLAIQAAIDSAINNGYPTVHFGGGRRYYVKDSSVLDIPNRGNPSTPSCVRGILSAGWELSANGKRLSLLGDGSTLYTDEERGGASYSPQQGGYVPDVLCVLTTLTAFSVQDLTIERGITGGRTDAPLNSSLSTNDRPTGNNRSGISILSYDESPVEGVTLRNVTFIDCHRALNFDDPRVLGDYSGKLKNVVVDGCKFLYPYGANIYYDGISAPGGGAGGAYTATVFTNWIDTLSVTNCTYDGAVGDNVATGYWKLPPDGFILASPSPNHNVCSGNTLRHFAFEGLYYEAAPHVAAVSGTQFTMPAIGGTTPWIAVSGTSLGSELQVSGTVYIGPEKPLIGSVPLGYTGTNGQVVFTGTSDGTGNLAIEEIASDRRSFRLRNDGDPFNPAPGVTVALADQSWVYYPNQIANSTVVITNNSIDQPLVTNGRDCSEVGIRVDDMQFVISNNIITSASTGIMLYQSNLSQGRMANSLVQGNSIKLADTTLNPGGFVSGIGSFADSIIIRDNNVQAPHSARVNGITIYTSRCQIVGNVIAASLHDSGDVDDFVHGVYGSSGIYTQYGADNYISGNTTQNLCNGIFINSQDGNGVPLPGVIADHTSINDVNAVIPDGYLYENQSLTLTATAAGWYKIEQDWSQNAFAMDVSITHNTMKADVELTFDTSGDQRNITQLDFVSLGSPIIDKIASDGYNFHAAWIHVTGSSSTPVQIKLQCATSWGGMLLSSVVPDAAFPPAVTDSQYRCLTFSSNGIKSLSGLGILNNPVGGPASNTPEFIGQQLVYNGQLYLATGLTSASWQALAYLGANANFANLTGSNGNFASVTGTTANFGSLSSGSANITSLIGNSATLNYITGTSTLGLGINRQIIATVQSGGLSLNQGEFESGSGSATAPGYSFNSDRDTGIYLATANPSSLGVALDGTDAMVISGRGTVVNGSITVSRIITSTDSPVITTGTGAGGAGRSATLDSNATDSAGQFIINTTGRPSSGTAVTVRFAHSYPTMPFVVICPANQCAAGIITPSAVALADGTGFNVSTGVAFTGGKTYKYNYIVVQGAH